MKLDRSLVEAREKAPDLLKWSPIIPKLANCTAKFLHLHDAAGRQPWMYFFFLVRLTGGCHGVRCHFFLPNFHDAEKLHTPAVPEFSDQRSHTVSAGEAFGPALQHAPAGVPFFDGKGRER